MPYLGLGSSILVGKLGEAPLGNNYSGLICFRLEINVRYPFHKKANVNTKKFGYESVVYDFIFNCVYSRNNFLRVKFNNVSF